MSKKILLTLYLPISIILCIIFSALVFSIFFSGSYYNYGVFLGINGEEIHSMDNYSLVVIEPSEFSQAQISQLKTEGKTVYGYINIGALEEYRPYFSDFSYLSLGVYENWQDERWIDVSNSKWQNFIIEELGKKYVSLGLDGFFADNADVYYHYNNEDIFNGLCNILTGLKQYKLPIVINGGDTFVSDCMDNGTALSLFDSINQETVFTSINFDNNTYGIQEKAETDYYKEYLANVKNYGLSVFLLEYHANPILSIKIERYCDENNFLWYNAKGLELK